MRCHRHTQLPCVLSCLRLALLIFQNSEGCTPAPVLHPFFSAKVKAAETTHVSPPFPRRRGSPPDEPSSTAASTGISPGTTARVDVAHRRKHDGKHVFLVTHAEAARQWCLPVVVVQAAGWRAVILSKKMWEKAKSKSREGWKESRSARSMPWTE